ncbi:MAG: hypothetical protein QXK93_01260 [Candidatus Bathyarchaeia archaeon]|nr:hypothetical protein [Candidatus Bathyarchaeota archaeon]
MSEEVEEVKRLLAFKKRIEKRIEKLESELKELQSILESVNTVLLAKGFKRAEIVKKPQVAEIAQPQTAGEVIQQPAEALVGASEFKEITALKTMAGEPLAKLYVRDNFMKIVLAEDKNFDANIPPFNQFLVERVLNKMQEKDGELAKAGKLKPEEIFTYNLVRDGNFIREIHIRNFDAERLRELKSSIKWTLERMYEKMKNPR